MYLTLICCNPFQKHTIKFLLALEKLKLSLPYHEVLRKCRNDHVRTPKINFNLTKGLQQGGRGWLAFGDRSRIPQSFRRARICKFSRQKRRFLQLRENRPFVVVKRLTHIQASSLAYCYTIFLCCLGFDQHRHPNIKNRDIPTSISPFFNIHLFVCLSHHPGALVEAERDDWMYATLLRQVAILQSLSSKYCFIFKILVYLQNIG